MNACIDVHQLFADMASWDEKRKTTTSIYHISELLFNAILLLFSTTSTYVEPWISKDLYINCACSCEIHPFYIGCVLFISPPLI